MSIWKMWTKCFLFDWNIRFWSIMMLWSQFELKNFLPTVFRGRMNFGHFGHFGTLFWRLFFHISPEFVQSIIPQFSCTPEVVLLTGITNWTNPGFVCENSRQNGALKWPKFISALWTVCKKFFNSNWAHNITIDKKQIFQSNRKCFVYIFKMLMGNIGFWKRWFH